MLERIRRYAFPKAYVTARGVSFAQSGTLRVAPGGGWKRFTARQTMSPHPPAFRWTARVRMVPLLSVRVTDALEDEVGFGEVRVLGVPVSREEGLASAQLTRWLAELPWCPAALDSPLIRWSAEDGRLKAALDSGEAQAQVTFDVADNGRITRASAMRDMRTKDGLVTAPWSGRFDGEISTANVRVPARAAVTWHLPDGDFECWRGEVTDYALKD